MRARFLVWQRHHILQILIGTAQEESDNTVEHTSFLQIGSKLKSRNSHSKDFVQDSFTEICAHLQWEGEKSCEQESTAVKETYCDQGGDDFLTHGGGSNVDPTWCSGMDASSEDMIATLNAAIATVCLPGWKGINTDAALVPHMHPHAVLAAQLTAQDVDAHGTYHIYTDGSCDIRKGKAAWAFTIVCAQARKGHTCFQRVGFAGGHVDCGLGPVSITAHDAEATAIVAACEYLLSRRDASQIQVHVHFDAIAAGFGSTGDSNLIQQDQELSCRQKAARIMVSLLQRCNSNFKGFHVHAHKGQPWNEMADSVAKQIVRGWTPPVSADLRSGVLLAHPMVEWAWIQIRPDAELPCLEVIMKNQEPHGCNAIIDATLTSSESHDRQSWYAGLNFATINVGTLHQDQVVADASVTFKAAELMQQFSEKNLHFVGVQESRARVSSTKCYGAFTCLIAAGDKGQAGVELWINEAAVRDALGLDFTVTLDVGVWHAAPRILAATCHLGVEAITIIVAYAPQRGLGEQAIAKWWNELKLVLQKCDTNRHIFVLGDLNCRIGSVESGQIGPVGAELEDLAGSFLRELCLDSGLCIPSTMSQFHMGPSWTHENVQGTRHRLDYILVSERCKGSIVESRTDYDMDMLNGDKDHKVALLSIEIHVSQRGKQGLKRIPLYDRDEARRYQKTCDRSLLYNFPGCDWLCDTNEHWSNMREHAQRECVRWFPKPKRIQRQHYISQHAWDILCHRKDLRKEHRSIQRERSMSFLKFLFEGWRNGMFTEETKEQWHRTEHLCRLQEAVVLEARRNVDAKFRRLKKNDWKQWITNSLARCVDDMKEANSADIWKILKPKKMVDRKQGKQKRPLPGLQDDQGQWKTSRTEIAMAWTKQFADIEHAKDTDLQTLLDNSKPQCTSITSAQVLQIPSLLDVERAMRTLNAKKATGVDNLGAEVWQMQVAQTAMRVFPLFLKSAVRKQAVVEHAGGWILPLFKGKGHPSKMTGYRAILLEPTLARIFSRAWRSRIAEGLAKSAMPMQWGGRKGLGISPLHLQVRLWQSNARHRQIGLALIFIDLKTAFYSVVKPMLASYDGSDEAIVHIFQLLNLPPSSFQAFLENVGNGDLLFQATRSEILADYVGANLAATWFTVPHGHGVSAPQTGTRPGDPCADLLFGFIMIQILQQINVRAREAEIPLQQHVEEGELTNCITWVDDVALAITAPASQLVQRTEHLLSIIMDVTLEHGMRMSYGQGKTAVVLDFKGCGAKECRQHCEAVHGDSLTVLCEHGGATAVPIVTHYKHLGGQIVRGGTLLPEIHIRSASARQNISPLKRILADTNIPVEHRSMLVKSMGISVLRLHAGTWFAMNQGELQAWKAGVHRIYQMLESRDSEGQVSHKSLYQLAGQMNSPMPVEMMYLERLRLFTQILCCFDKWVITAILYNYRLAGKDSWLYGLQRSMAWAQTQIGQEHLPDELLHLNTWQCWMDFRDAARQIKKIVRQVEKAHLLRIRTYIALWEHSQFQGAICKEMGWELSAGCTEQDEPDVVCEVCCKSFSSQAALAAHQQRKHNMRMAIRRFVRDGICRACARHFHSRCRLLRHLQWSGTNCWMFHLRTFVPMDEDETQRLDDLDRSTGHALHQRDLRNAVVGHMWRTATEDELQPVLQVTYFDGDPVSEPTSDELETWSAWGLLPPGAGGRSKTSRKASEWFIHNTARDIPNLEHQLLENVKLWQPNYDWVPRPLAEGAVYFLNFFSGHRRMGDVSSWFHWDGRVIPIAIDLAIDEELGDIHNTNLWYRLIAARKVVGGHGGPPCETYSAARWNAIERQQFPRPLRDIEQPWGKLYITLRELCQCYTGTCLMLTTLKLLFMIHAYGGSISLEHPAGDNNNPRMWGIWKSAFIKWLMLDAQISSITFLQGPLGQSFAKPTTMLLGRLSKFAELIFANYDKSWKASEVLSGKEGQSWRTSKAKAYPEKLSKVIALAHLHHFESLTFEGEAEEPAEMLHVLEKLATMHDPYNPDAANTTMRSDYHARRL